MTETIKNFIDGELVESATTDFIELVDPVTGEADGRSPVSLPEEVDRAYAAAERALASRPTPSRSALPSPLKSRGVRRVRNRW